MPRPTRPWCRLYSELLESRKVQALKPALFRHWINLLALANEQRVRGRLPSMADVAYRLRVTEAQAQGLTDDLLRVGLVDREGDALVMHDWDEWQPESDANLTPGRAEKNERTRIERAKNANRTRNGGDNAGNPRSMRGADPDPDTDTEEETETDPDPERARARAIVPRRQLLRAFERAFGRMFSPLELESIAALGEEHPQERIEFALREAAERNARSIRYVQAVCEGQAEKGDNRERPRNGGRNDASGNASAELERLYRVEPSELVLD